MKKFINVLMLILLIVAIFVFYEEMKSIRIDAVDLSEEYTKNKYEADKKFLQKEIEITGIVIAHYSLNQIGEMLQLKTDDNSLNIYCFFQNRSDEIKVNQLQPNDIMTATGICVGMDKYKFIKGIKIEVKKIKE
jgi:hypothetical protein